MPMDTRLIGYTNNVATLIATKDIELAQLELGLAKHIISGYISPRVGTGSWQVIARGAYQYSRRTSTRITRSLDQACNEVSWGSGTAK